MFPVTLAPPAWPLVAGVPALAWLLWSRKRGHPTWLLAGMVLAGALVASPIAAFVTELLPRGNASFSPWAPDRLVATFAVVAMTQELAKLATLRFTVYASLPAPRDALLVSVAVGLGFAAAASFHSLQEANGRMLLAESTGSILVTALTHASLGAILGAFIATARFEPLMPRRRNLILFAGLVVAAVLGGAFRLVVEAAAYDGLERQPWTPLAGSALFALLLAVATWLVARKRLPARAEAM